MTADLMRCAACRIDARAGKPAKDNCPTCAAVNAAYRANGWPPYGPAGVTVDRVRAVPLVPVKGGKK